MGKGSSSNSSPNPYLAVTTDDNLEMIADLFRAMQATGKDPDMPIKEIADIGLQLIDMLREKEAKIRELRQMHEGMMAQQLQQGTVAWDPGNNLWTAAGPFYTGGTGMKVR